MEELVLHKQLTYFCILLLPLIFWRTVAKFALSFFEMSPTMLTRLALTPGTKQSSQLSDQSGWNYRTVSLCPANSSIISCVSWGG